MIVDALALELVFEIAPRVRFRSSRRLSSEILDAAVMRTYPASRSCVDHSLPDTWSCQRQAPAKGECGTTLATGCSVGGAQKLREKTRESLRAQADGGPASVSASYIRCMRDDRDRGSPHGKFAWGSIQPIQSQRSTPARETIPDVTTPDAVGRRSPPGHFARPTDRAHMRFGLPHGLA